MKHTKNILKSLLIMVMALLLLAVSCKKDEGGSKPTDPTPITLGVDELNDIVMKFVKSQTSWKVDADASTAFKPTSGNGSISVTVNKAFADIQKLKQALTTYSSGGITITATANSSSFGPSKVDESAAANFDITIDIGNNNFAEEVKNAYAVKDKTAKLILKIAP